jgi:hypothetical protein
MKKRVIKILKGFFLFIGVLLIIITATILWPMPTIEAPKKHTKILITSIDIIE